MERFLLCVLDGARVIDKIKIKKKDINKKFFDSNTGDHACIMSKDVAEFLNKHS